MKMRTFYVFVMTIILVSLTMVSACALDQLQKGDAEKPDQGDIKALPGNPDDMKNVLPDEKSIEIKKTKPADGGDNSKPFPQAQLDAKAYYNRGLAAASYENAIQEYSKALELDPNFAEAYLGRGDAYSGLERAPEAVKDYSKYLELKPKDIFGYYKRAAAYSYTGDYQRCIEDWDRVITQFPKEANLYYSRGTCYELLGKIEQAVEDYKTSAKLGYGPAQDELKSRGIQW